MSGDDQYQVMAGRDTWQILQLCPPFLLEAEKKSGESQREPCPPPGPPQGSVACRAPTGGQYPSLHLVASFGIYIKIFFSGKIFQ